MHACSFIFVSKLMMFSIAAVHAARLYLRESGPDKAIIKLDFKNAFNSIRRDKVLSKNNKSIIIIPA